MSTPPLPTLLVLTSGEPDPGELLAQVTRVYTTCRTYRDEGSVARELCDPAGRTQDLAPANRFSTAFVRPGRFRLDYRHHGDGPAKRSAIWTTQDGTRSWWDLDNQVEHRESLDFALGAHAGVTSGVSVEVPNLLLATELDPKSGRVAPFSQLKALKLMPPVEVEGSACDRVEGRRRTFNVQTWKPFDAVFTYTIEKSSALIRMVRIEMVFEEGQVVTTITYHPHLDEPVPDALLTFDPATISQE